MSGVEKLSKLTEGIQITTIKFPGRRIKSQDEADEANEAEGALTTSRSYLPSETRLLMTMLFQAHQISVLNLKWVNIGGVFQLSSNNDNAYYTTSSMKSRKRGMDQSHQG